MLHLLRAFADLVGDVGQRAAQLCDLRAVELLIFVPLIHYRLRLVEPQAPALEQVGPQLLGQFMQQGNAVLFY